MTAPQAPEGFRPVQAEAPLGPRIDKTSLGGVIVRYERTARFPKRDGGGTTVVHSFKADAGKGRTFSVFGTADLDSKIRNVKPGSIVWLMYGGKKQLDDQERHVWYVNNAGLQLDPARLAELRKNSVEKDAALERAIVKADSEYAARRDAGNGAPADYDEREFTDDEVPVQ